MSSNNSSGRARVRSGRRKTDEASGSNGAIASGGPGPKGIQAPPDVVYKMSKKIAQLTKVIYYLNTKNEDHNVEVQSLIDAYEDELSEAIRDGTGQIQDLQGRLEESTIRLQAHEDVIQTYLETIAANEAEIHAVKEEEKDLRARYEKLESNYHEMESSHSKSLAKASKELVESAHELRAEHEEEVSGLVVDYQRRMKEMEAEHAEKIEKMEAEHKSKLRQQADNITDEKIKDSLMERVKIVEEQLRSALVENKDLRGHYDQRLKEAAVTLDDTEKKLNDDVSRYVEAQEVIHQLSASDFFFLRKDASIHALLQEVEDRAVKTANLEYQVQSETMRADTYKKELTLTSAKLHETIQTLAAAEEDVAERVRVQALTDERMHASEELLEKTQAEVANLTSNLESALSTIRELNDKIQELTREKADAIVAKVESDRAHKEVIAEMEQMRIDMLEDKQEALLRLENELTARFTAELDGQRASYEKMLQDVRREMEDVRLKLKAEIAHLYEKMEAERRAADERFAVERGELKAEIKRVEGEREGVRTRLVETEGVLSEKVKEIARLNDKVHRLEQTVKKLEDDKADLFQKMVRIDDQIRAEMNEVFRKEKIELQETMAVEHTREMEGLRDTLTLEHHRAQLAALQKAEAEFAEKMQVVTDANNAAAEEWEATKKMLDDQIALSGEEKGSLLKAVVDLKEEHSRVVSFMNQTHTATLETERRQLEFDASTRENQLKVSSTIALQNLERKHKQQLAELESSQKRQLDEIRQQNTINTLALKRDAESARFAEVAKTKKEAEIELEKCIEAHVEETAKVVLNMNIQRMADLRALGDEHDGRMAIRMKEIDGLKDVIKAHEATAASLRQDISTLKDKVYALDRELQRKEKEIEQLRIDSERELQSREAELAAEAVENIRQVNEDHLAEAQKMLTEFEKAQTFLKKQIANQAKQLQDADLKYINREPREVDLQRIADLEEDIRRRKRRAAALAEELDYCKLELNNREANFNKIFNKNPLVGVIEPLKGSPGKVCFLLPSEVLICIPSFM
ncbi:hypothetical protein HK101_009645 [Irineochytrium annulatum]|nr:hypothetical protein HK101_009645 [Irineochytrium annulatum]